MKKISEILVAIKDRTWITQEDFDILTDWTWKILYNRNFNRDWVKWFKEDVLTEALVKVNWKSLKWWPIGVKKYFIQELVAAAYELSFMFDYPVDIPKWVLKFLESSYTWSVDYPVAWDAIKSLQRTWPNYSLLDDAINDWWSQIKDLNIHLLLNHLVLNKIENQIIVWYILWDKTFNDLWLELWLSKENVRKKYYRVLETLKIKLKDSQNI